MIVQVVYSNISIELTTKSLLTNVLELVSIDFFGAMTKENLSPTEYAVIFHNIVNVESICRNNFGAQTTIAE